MLHEITASFYQAVHRDLYCGVISHKGFARHYIKQTLEIYPPNSYHAAQYSTETYAKPKIKAKLFEFIKYSLYTYVPGDMFCQTRGFGTKGAWYVFAVVMRRFLSNADKLGWLATSSAVIASFNAARTASSLSAAVIFFNLYMFLAIASLGWLKFILHGSDT